MSIGEASFQPTPAFNGGWSFFATAASVESYNIMVGLSWTGDEQEDEVMDMFC